MKELAIAVPLAAYLAFWAWAALHFRAKPVPRWVPLLCLALVLPPALLTWGAGHDIGSAMRVAVQAKDGHSPWAEPHANFAYLPGYPALMSLLAFVYRPGPLNLWVKAINALALVLTALLAARLDPGADRRERAFLYLACQPALVAVAIWHGHYEAWVGLGLAAAFVAFSIPGLRGGVWSGFFLGLAVSVKHWPLFLAPLWLQRPLKRSAGVALGAAAGLAAVFLVFHLRVGDYAQFGKVLAWQGMPSTDSHIFHYLGMQAPEGWARVCLGLGLGLGLFARWRGAGLAESFALGALGFVLFNDRVQNHYLTWSLVPLYVSGRHRHLGIALALLAGAAVCLYLWGASLDAAADFPHLRQALAPWRTVLNPWLWAGMLGVLLLWVQRLARGSGSPR